MWVVRPADTRSVSMETQWPGLRKVLPMRWALLDGIPEDELREILTVARRRTFSRGEIVFHRGDPADSCHLVVSGRFAVRIMTALGDTATIALRGPGSTFGEMALVVAGGNRSATIAALEKAETLSLYRDDFDAIRATYPAANQFLWRFLVNEVRMLNERLLEALYLPVDRRVRRRLLDLSDVYGDGDGEVSIPLTQEVIAELAGASRPTVNQVLREEARRGAVRLERGKTVVLDRQLLERRSR